MSRAPFALLAILVVAACNLPTDADAARDRLAKRSESTAALTVPFPVVRFDPVDFLARNDASLHVILGSTAESIRYPTHWRTVDVSGALTSFNAMYAVQAADFGPQFGALLELVKIQNVAVRFEIENTGDLPVSYDGVELALHDAAGAVVQRALPAAGAAVGTVAAKSTQSVDIPVTALAELLVSDIAHGRDLHISVTVNQIGIVGGTSLLRTRAVLVAPITIEFGSREVHYRHVMHEKFDGDEDLLRDLHSLEVDSAWLELDILNALPVALHANIAIAPTPPDTTGFDPLTAAERLQVETVQIAAAQAQPDGTVTARAVTHASIPLSAETVDLLRSGVVSLGGEFTISASTDRVKIGVDNSFELKASARIRVRHKGH